MKYTYAITVDQDTNDILGQILLDGTVIDQCPAPNMQQAALWVAARLAEVNPEGPCRMTRKRVYNYRVYGSPGYWELRVYNAKGEEIDKGQFRDVMPEGYLSGLVQDQMGFPLEAAEEIE